MAYKKCKRCNTTYDVSAFACMRADGERSDSTIAIYGDEYDLCPKCTSELYKFIYNLEKSQNVNAEKLNLVISNIIYRENQKALDSGHNVLCSAAEYIAEKITEEIYKNNNFGGFKHEGN